MATLKDVAQEAGVSMTTVSVVLGGKADSRGIAMKTRTRVREAADKLGFQVNRHARALRTGKTQLIGIVGVHLSLPLPRMILYSLSERLLNLGYNILPLDLAWTRNFRSKSLRPEMIDSSQVDGIILIDVADKSIRKWVEDVSFDRTAVVSVDDKGVPDADVVTVNRKEGAYLAVSHLLKLGHRRIVMTVSPHAHNQVLLDRIEGYRRACREYDLPFDPSLLLDIHGVWPYQVAGQQVARQVMEHPARPTAMFAVNDLVAIGAMQQFYAAGLRIPDDIAVVGFDGTEEAEYTHVPLTTVTQPVQEIASNVVSLLTSRIQDYSRVTRQRTVILSPTLHIRASCGGRQAQDAQ